MSEYEVSGSSEQNFIVKGNKAYTEDGVPVFNLYLYNISPKLTHRKIYNYFSIFGELHSVRLLGGQQCTRRYGFANFVKESSAFRALQIRDHYLHGHRIDVTVADSWNQPYAEEQGSFDSSSSDDYNFFRNSGVQSFNILQLSDDSLEHICRMLELPAQLRFARVCQRFCNVFEMFSQRAYKNFDLGLTRSLTLWETREFFHIVGAYIEKLTGDNAIKNRERVFSFIRIFCTNLNYIVLCDFHMRARVFRMSFKAFQSLKELWLCSCYMNDQSLRPLFHIGSLEILGLPDNIELTGRFLRNLQQLKVLNLYGCINVKSEHLIDALVLLDGLKSLDIRHCEGMSEDMFVVMEFFCKELQEVKISCPDVSYERVAELPRLRKLELLRSRAEDDINHTQFFTHLVRCKAHQLEHLKIISRNTLTTERIDLIAKLRKLKTLLVPFNQVINDTALRQLQELKELQEINFRSCQNITNEGILGLMRSCKHLRRINVQFCNKISIGLITKAIRVLEPRKYTLEKPVVILAFGSNITENGLSNISEYNAETKAFLLAVEIVESDPADVNDLWDLKILDEDFYDELMLDEALDNDLYDDLEDVLNPELDDDMTDEITDDSDVVSDNDPSHDLDDGLVDDLDTDMNDEVSDDLSHDLDDGSDDEIDDDIDVLLVENLAVEFSDGWDDETDVDMAIVLYNDLTYDLYYGTNDESNDDSDNNWNDDHYYDGDIDEDTP